MLTERGHVFAAPNGQESDERNLHAGKRTQRIPSGVANIEAWAVTAHADEHKGVQGKQVGNKNVSTPCRHHVAIEQRTEGAPESRANLQGLDPQVKGEDKQENGNCLVVVTSSDRTRNVAWRNANEGSGEEASRRRLRHLGREEVRGESRQARESGREEHANVPNVNGDGQEAEDVVNDTASNHEAGIEGTASNTAQWMPCPCKKPISVS